MRNFIAFILFFAFSFTSFSQTEIDSSSILKKRFKTVYYTQSAFTIGSLLALNEAWYKNFHSNTFRFFNDNTEWLQMDKLGHVYSAYHLTQKGAALYQWCGLEKNKADIVGGVYAYSFLLGIELLDGFSEKWGFSWGDLSANTLGTTLAIAQSFTKSDEYFTLKFSFSESGYAPIRPNLLGKTFAEQLLKDYNGQSYWLSLSPSSILNIDKSWFPKWLNLALGYSGDGMIAARNGQIVEISSENSTYYLTAKHNRQFYISLDIDLRKIPVKNPFLKNMFYAVNMIKIPAPALEINKYSSKFHYFYF